MKTENIVLLGAGLGLTYLVFNKQIGRWIDGLGKGTTDTIGAVGDIAQSTSQNYDSLLDTTTEAANSWIDLLNLKKDYAAIQTLAGQYMTNNSSLKAQVADLTTKNAGLNQNLSNFQKNTVTYVSKSSPSVVKNTPPQTFVSSVTKKVEANPFAYTPNVSLSSGGVGQSFSKGGILSYI